MNGLSISLIDWLSRMQNALQMGPNSLLLEAAIALPLLTGFVLMLA